MRGAFGVFLVFTALYIGLLPPSLPPYRDAGEMTSSAFTLGVSHPTGYPLYILLGRLAQALPLGNGAYRLALLSAAAAAAALAGLYLVLRRRTSVCAALGAVALLGFNQTFLSVALVPEMYSLWMLLAVALAGMALRLRESPGPRLWLAFAFLYGLALGNRLDLLLWACGLLWLALPRVLEPPPRSAGVWAVLCGLAVPAAIVGLGSNLPILVALAATLLWFGPPSASWLGRTAAAAGLGLSVYLYLPVRSATGPWLDWNHPASLPNLLETILRSKYGGTLDLLSKNYAPGAMFVENLKVYARHLWSAFTPLGLLAAAAGAAALFKRDLRSWTGLAAAYWWSGPVFLFMANMPPNPHALAIVEPHYLLSDLILTLWAAEGLALVPTPAAAALAAALALWPAADGRLKDAVRRGHFFSYDFAKNVLRSVAPGGVLVAKKDVQLYTLWHYQRLHGWRPDVRVLSQGLAGSAWYQAGWRRQDPRLAVGPLRTAEDWRRAAALNGPLAFTHDAEPPGGIDGPPAGLTVLFGGDPDPRRSFPLWELMSRRGGYDYEAQPDFFTSDLIEAHAQARYRWGTAAFGAGERALAREHLLGAWAQHWLMPDAAAFLGYHAFSAGDWAQARRRYARAAALYDRTAELAEEYHSLPDLKSGVRKLRAETRMHLGVAHERLGERDRAESLYREALGLYPLAQARFNLAAMFWDRDWARVEEELRAALAIDPNHPEARRFLALLEFQKRRGPRR